MGRNVWVYVMTEALTWWMKKNNGGVTQISKPFHRKQQIMEWLVTGICGG